MSETPRRTITLAEALARDACASNGIIRVPSLADQPVPERQWLVPNLIPRGAVTLLSGDGGTGKSLLAMQLMAAGATAGKAGGGKWIGIDVPRFAALGLFCEDDEQELHRRQCAINAHLGCSFADLAGLYLWPRVGKESVLMSYAGDGRARASTLMQTIEEFVRANAIELIVIDTAADVFGGNENIRNEVRSFLQHLHALAAINNGAVLLTSHPSVAGQASGSGLSGSTAWNNSVRSRLYLKRPAGLEDDDGDARELRSMKSNYASSGARLKLRWQAGVFARDEASGTGMVAMLEARNLAKRFTELVTIARERGLDLSPHASNAYAPTVLAALPEADKLQARALARGMHQALKDGLVVIELEGPPSKQRRRLAPAA